MKLSFLFEHASQAVKSMAHDLESAHSLASTDAANDPPPPGNRCPISTLQPEWLEAPTKAQAANDDHPFRHLQSGSAIYIAIRFEVCTLVTQEVGPCKSRRSRPATRPGAGRDGRASSSAMRCAARAHVARVKLAPRGHSLDGAPGASGATRSCPPERLLQPSKLFSQTAENGQPALGTDIHRVMELGVPTCRFE